VVTATNETLGRGVRQLSPWKLRKRMRLFEEVRQNDVEAAPTLLLERLFVCGRGRTESLQACFLLHSFHVHIHAHKRVHPKFLLIATFCTSYTAQLHRSHTQ